MKTEEKIPKFYELGDVAQRILSVIMREYSRTSFYREDIRGRIRDSSFNVHKGFRELVDKGLVEEDNARKPYKYKLSVNPTKIMNTFHRQLDDLFLGENPLDHQEIKGIIFEGAKS